jgi:hypothetical protein
MAAPKKCEAARCTDLATVPFYVDGEIFAWFCDRHGKGVKSFLVSSDSRSETAKKNEALKHKPKVPVHHAEQVIMFDQDRGELDGETKRGDLPRRKPSEGDTMGRRTIGGPCGGSEADPMVGQN